MEKNVGIIILAAGNSSRLGQPKQLLEYKGFTLLRNTILQAKLVPKSTVIIVTGAYKQLMDKELSSIATNTVYNPYWESGMASSIAIGLHKLLALNPKIKTCIFTVCDQPFLTTAVFINLLNEHIETDKGIISSFYAETLGVPALFSEKYFESLFNLKGQEGAKKIIKKYKDDMISIPFEKGTIDIDTIDDYTNLINHS